MILAHCCNIIHKIWLWIIWILGALVFLQHVWSNSSNYIIEVHVRKFDVQHMSGKFRTWTCCCRFQSISTVVLIKAEESIIKTCSTLQIIKYERKQIGWHRQQQVWKVWIVFSGLFNGSLTWCWGHSCRFCVRRTFT